MAECFVVLIDRSTSSDDAPEIGKQIIDTLIDEQLILPEANCSCVLGGRGFPPGPRVHEIYATGDRGFRFWEKLRTNGVQVCSGRYVNYWGIPYIESLRC